MRAVAVFAAVLLSACSGRGGTAAAPPAPRGAVLRYDIGGTAVPSPVVRGSVGDVHTLLIVDTGAQAHVVMESVAAAAHLDSHLAPAEGYDSLGHAFALAITDRPPLAVEGWGAVAADGAAVVPAPPFLETLGVGGILSPQLLATEERAVLLDLERGRLDSVRWAAGERLLAARGAPLITFAHRTCHDRDPFPGLETLEFVVGGIMESEVLLLALDTGSRVTTIFEGTPTADAFGPRAVESAAPAHGLSSTAKTREVKGLLVRVGDVERTLDVQIGPGPAGGACAFDGLLGMDFLRNCVLLLGPEKMAGACGLPGGDAAKLRSP